MRLYVPLVVLGSAALLGACGTTPEEPSAVSMLGPGALVSYAFLDASVPPPYHRSYELTVRADESRIVVDSYGDVLADERKATDPAAWSTMGATLGDVTGLSAQEPEVGCTGGTVTSLTVVQEGDVLVDLVLDECAGVNAEAVEAVNAWIAPARDQFPPMDVLAPEGE